VNNGEVIMSHPYSYPLLIGQILQAPLHSTNRIVHGEHDLSYRDLAARVARAGAVYHALGLGHGSVIAVMDWDSHRYLESFFAIPMLGATLHTVNVRLSPEQILYTINHAQDDAILVHEDFLPLLLPLLPRIERPVKLVLLSDRTAPPIPEGFAGEYEALIAAASEDFRFEEFDENTRATLFYTTGTTGDPRGVSYSHRQLVLHTLGVMAGLGPVPGNGGVHRRDIYMPLTPLFHVHAWGFPYVATMLGLKQVYPGRYEPVKLLALIQHHGVTFSHCVPTILAMLLAVPEETPTDLSRWKVIIGGAALPEGMTAAEYAHRGAYPLLVTALLAGGFALAARPFAAEDRRLRMLLLLWLAQNVALTISALLRLELYVEAFGLTYLRLHSAIWMGLVAAGLGLTGWQVWRGLPNGWLLLRTVGLGVGVLYAACFVNFAAIIAAENLKRPTYDAGYVCSLGPTAMGAIQASGRDVVVQFPDGVGSVWCALSPPQIDGWRDWGFRDWRVRRYLDAVAEGVHEDPRGG